MTALTEIKEKLTPGKSKKFDVEETLARMTMSQKIKILCGKGWWHTEDFPQAGVDSMRFSDGPNGARGTRFFNGVPSSCFPSSTGLGSSFDLDLAREVGEALGDECRAKSTHVLLGPTVNTQRSPLGGRGFESFAEDPYLNGNVAAAYINGLQSKGVAATIKHFVANDQEFERFSISSDVSDRALREIYLKPFQIAIKKSNPWALMSSYNRLNGLHVSENPWLLDEILRKEWGFQGMVMSDWIGVYSTAESIKAGLDLEMPGPTVMRGAAIDRALIAQKLFPEDIDARVRNILTLLAKAHESGIPFNGPEEGVDTPQLRALLRRAASSAVVLLKNEKSLLPLSLADKPLKKIAVIGPNAKTAFASGGGSANLLASWKVSPLQGIHNALHDAGLEGKVDVQYAVGGQTHQLLPLLDGYMSMPEEGKQQGGGDVKFWGGSEAEKVAFVEFWNEEPAEGDWVQDVNTKAGRKADWTTPTGSSYCFLMDGIDEEKVNQVCWIRYTTTYTPDTSGPHTFSLTLAGNGTLSINGTLLIDLSVDPPQGDSFFGLGTADVQGRVPYLEKGQKVEVEIRVSNRDFVGKGGPFSTRGGIRLGGCADVKEEVAREEAVKVAQEADVAIVVVGLTHELESEGFDRPHMKLPGATDALVSAVLKANPNTIVVNQSGTPVEMPWIDDAPTILQAFYGGNELGNGLADVLFGKVNPSSKLALTFPKRLEDNPSFPSYGDKAEAHGKILYNEGIYVGYRSYDKRSLEPLFPFGFGLSYTTFSYTDLKVSTPSFTPSSKPTDLSFTVSFTLTNTGSVPGAESAQIYISYPNTSFAPHAPQQLKGFAKTKVLKPGESETLKVELDRDAFAWWDERVGRAGSGVLGLSGAKSVGGGPGGRWLVEKGVYGVAVAASSRDSRLSGSVEVKETLEWLGL